LTAGAAPDTPRTGTIGGANAIVLPQVAIIGCEAENGATQSTFIYSIPAGGTFVLAPWDQNGQTPM